MIDLHIHILPGLDDGAADMEEAAEMAEIAAFSGTSVIAATPHCNMAGIFDTIWGGEYQEKWQGLRRVLAERGIPLTVAAGMELFGTADLPEKLRAGELITLNNSRYPLVEFDFQEEADFIFLVMERLLHAGFQPVLAHPERYSCVAENLQMVYELYRMGVVIQINKGSVLGRFGRRVQRTVNAILRHRLAAAAASDAHGCDFRTPDLSDFRKALDLNYGEGCSPLLLEENPRRILADQDVLWESPIPF